MKVGDREVPIGRLEDTSEPDESMHEWWERFNAVMDDNLVPVLSHILDNEHGYNFHAELRDVTLNYFKNMDDDRLKALVLEIENA